MTIRRYTIECRVCGQRTHGKPLGTACPSCGGRTRIAPAHKKRTIDRTVFRERQDQCKSCVEFGKWMHGWGCNLLRKPCHLERRWICDDPNWCPKEAASVKS